jgi:hypothetical protein
MVLGEYCWVKKTFLKFTMGETLKLARQILKERLMDQFD